MDFLVIFKSDKQESNGTSSEADMQLKMRFFPVQRRLYRAP
jgi:hypothetical protein